MRQKIISLAIMLVSAATANAQDFVDCIQTDLLDAVVRIQHTKGRQSWSGTGSIVKKGETKNGDPFYWVITNHHVAEGKGSPNTVEAWNYGRKLDDVKTKTHKSWYQKNVGKDIALMTVRADAYPGEMPVIPLAAAGVHDPQVGETIVICGCGAGIHPSASIGVIVRVEQGLIYYLEKAVGGNSGGPIYNADQTQQIGVTAWRTTINLNGRSTEVGLAMSADLVWRIMTGEVFDGPSLPPETFEIVQQDDRPRLSLAPSLPGQTFTMPQPQPTPQDFADGDLPGSGDDDLGSGGFKWRPPRDRGDMEDLPSPPSGGSSGGNSGGSRGGATGPIRKAWDSFAQRLSDNMGSQQQDFLVQLDNEQKSTTAKITAEQVGFLRDAAENRRIAREQRRVEMEKWRSEQAEIASEERKIRRLEAEAWQAEAQEKLEQVRQSIGWLDGFKRGIYEWLTSFTFWGLLAGTIAFVWPDSLPGLAIRKVLGSVWTRLIGAVSNIRLGSQQPEITEAMIEKFLAAKSTRQTRKKS